MCDDPKEIVKFAYDNIADWYLEWVENQQSPRERYTTKLLDNCHAMPQEGFSRRPHVLDLGCGPGVPVLQMLLSGGASVVASDISTKQLELAKARYPEANLIQGDMSILSFEPASFHGLVCFYTLFHLPRTEQQELLSKVFSWLRPGGMFVFNCATFDEEEIHGEFLGFGTFWSSYCLEGNKAMLDKVGFEVVQAELLEAGDGQLEEGEPDHGASFWWVAARKPLQQVEGKL